ncbi:MAG: glycolate oxidase subunit GlcE [Burkholderiaceae bacterium]|nr:glycolate oxidase subunit GlcE [Burkholderiaceae bacterium]
MDIIQQWSDVVQAAAAQGSSVCLRGGGTKDFYGRCLKGQPLDTRQHAGIKDYEPSELVITVKGGTSLAELEAVLAGQNQFLAFEPPHFGEDATVAGCLAAGLSGPRRMAVGAVRDFVLGVKLMDGRGDVQTFGGQVMKNVAGYDVSRLIAGSLGTLGIVLDVSLKVLPRPVSELTLRLAMTEEQAIHSLNTWGGRPLPISASVWVDDVLTLRLSGAESATRLAREQLGGELIARTEADLFWRGVREQRHDWFNKHADTEIWRVSVPSVAGSLGLPGSQLIEWGGALRWVSGPQNLEIIRQRATQLGGHATCFRGQDRAGDVFHPLEPGMLVLHRKLKQAFDPAGVFNPGRIYQGL